MILLTFILFAVVVYLFIIFIIKRDRGHKEPIGALFAAMGFGILAVILASILNEIFIPSEVFESIGTNDAQHIPAATLLASMIGVGFIEETLKCIPLALFIYKKRYFDELTDGIIYFGIVGLTFGIIEDILYSLEFGGGVGLFRILISPYLHVSFTILFGMFLIQRKLLKRSWAIVVVGYLAAVLAHGFFNFFPLIGGFGFLMAFAITISLNVSLFVFFRRSQLQDEHRGVSAIGINKFCRHCGKPNPERLLYCSFCGKHS